MAHRIRKETKQQPGTAGTGNMLGCCLVSFHFLWAILSTSTEHTPARWWHICTKDRHQSSCQASTKVHKERLPPEYFISVWIGRIFSALTESKYIMGWEMIRLLMQLNPPPSLCPVQARGRETRKRNPHHFLSHLGTSTSKGQKQGKFSYPCS